MAAFIQNKNIICIGGIGGSGTRLFADIFAEHMYMGPTINDSSDNITFTLLFKRIQSLSISQNEFKSLFTIFSKVMTKQELSRKDKSNITAIYLEKTRQDYLYDKKLAYDLSMFGDNKIENITNWGWKEPNTHVLLPHILKMGPEYKYIHIYRDAFSSAINRNQNQVKFWYSRKVTPVISVDYWIMVQEKMIKLKEQHPNSIFFIDYTTFIKSPEYYMSDLEKFTGYKFNLSKIKSMIKEPSKKPDIDFTIFKPEQKKKVDKLIITLSVLNKK